MADPSDVGKLNAVPPEVIITLLPSDAIDSLASCNCKVGVPPVSVNNSPVSCTCVNFISLLTPKFNIEASETKLKSSPTDKSALAVTFPDTVVVPSTIKFSFMFKSVESDELIVVPLIVTAPSTTLPVPPG